jgi:uncharacterized SAM-binding protein YcdF (DUF218 family)
MMKRLIGILLFAWLIGFVAFSLNLPKAGGETITDGVVVLTGGKDRIQRGVDVLQRQYAKRLLISGVDRTIGLDQIANSYHIPSDLTACCIDVGWEAIDTKSNARETATWIKQNKFTSIRIVTNNWHMIRARFELSRAIPPSVTLISDSVEVEPSFGILFEEYNKYLWRRAITPFDQG